MLINNNILRAFDFFDDLKFILITFIKIIYLSMETRHITNTDTKENNLTRSETHLIC